MAKSSLDEIYSFYIIRIILNGKQFYCLWGPNTKKMDDQFLLDKNLQIILFKKISHIKELKYNLTKYNFKTIRFKKWLESIEKLKSSKSYCTFDFDYIFKTFAKLSDPFKLNPKQLNDYINFINLAGDYAHQIKDAMNNDLYIELYREKNLSLLWEYTYDIYFWGVQGKEKIKITKKLKQNWNKKKFQSAFQKQYNIFIESFTLL